MSVYVAHPLTKTLKLQDTNSAKFIIYWRITDVPRFIIYNELQNVTFHFISKL